MITNKREKNCPVCGTIGREFTEHPLRSCNGCGTVYNKFGVLFETDRDDELQWT